MLEAQQLGLLMVEDSESDCLLFQLALESAGVNMRLHSVSDGQEAIDYLLASGVHSNPLPDVIVLDLRMRKVSGIDFLNWCRRTPACQEIPVVVLTGAFDGDGEIQSALAAGATRAYIKPISVSSLESIVREIYEFGLKRRASEGSSASVQAKAA
ncbi:MAG TPA: response regulator [Bacillota bacterium]|nr:response regulator [Bacillota bacterium]